MGRTKGKGPQGWDLKRRSHTGKHTRGKVKKERRPRRRLPRISKDVRALSEVVGTVLMLGTSITLVSIIGVLLSNYNEKVPEIRVELSGSYSSGVVYLLHQGGEPLYEEDVEIRILINDDERYSLKVSEGLDGEEIFDIGDEWSYPITLGNGSQPTVSDSIILVVIDRKTKEFVFEQTVQEGPAQGQVPDMEITASNIWLEYSGGALEKDEASTIHANITNVGSWVGKNALVRFFAGDEFIPDAKIVASLAPGNATSVNVSWIPSSYGLWVISVHIVPLSNEVNFENNYAVIDQMVGIDLTVDQLHGPDLVVTTSDVTFSPTNPMHGDNVTITVTIRNNGDIGVIDTAIRVYDNTISTLVTLHTGVSVAAGGQVQLTTAWSAAPGGVHYINVRADHLEQVTEILESNNEVTVPVEVLPNILLVDDDGVDPGNGLDATSALYDALIAVGVTLDLHIVIPGSDGPTFDSSAHPLSEYDIVIWTCGFQFNSTLKYSDLVALMTYLDSGGFLWLLGQDILDEISTTPEGLTFIEDYLRVEPANISFDEGTPSILDGYTGDPISDGLRLNTSGIIAGLDGCDDMEALNQSVGSGVLGNETDSMENNTVRYNSPSAGSKVVFQSWEFSAVVRSSDRALLAYRVLRWLDWSLTVGNDVAVTSMDFSLERPRYLDTVTLSAMVRNNGASTMNTTVAFYVDESLVPAYPDYEGNPQQVSIPPYGGEVTVEKEWVATESGIHVMRVMVDPYNVINEINEVNNDITYSLMTEDMLEVREVVLVVDDDGSSNNGGTNPDYVSNLTEALNFLDYDYDVVEVQSGGDGPNVDYMKHYNTVAWFTGEDGRGVSEVTLSSGDQENLTDYLQGNYDEATYLGGLHVNIWLCGQDILYDLTGGVSGPTGAGTFERDIMRVASYIESVSLPVDILGVRDDPISHGLEMEVNVTGTNYGDALVPMSDVSTILTDDSDRSFGLKYNDPEYSLVFLPYEFSFAGWNETGDGGSRRSITEDMQMDAWALPIDDEKDTRGPKPRTTIFSEDFESGAGAWTHGGGVDIWELGVPAYSGAGYGISEDHTTAPGVNCWGTDLDATSDIGQGNGCWLRSPQIALPASGLTTLQYYIWYDLNNAGSADDDAWLNISTDGGASWSQLDPPPGWPGWVNDVSDGASSHTPSYEGDTGGLWKEVLVDLSAYNGNNIRLQWHYLDASSDATSRAGVYIDDVVVVSIPPNAAPELEFGDVSPQVGNTATSFEYDVTYSDSENEAPTSAFVYIDGAPYPMSTDDTVYTDGSLFTRSMGLSAGVHNYFFWFSDGHSNTRLPTTGFYVGPIVSIAGGGPGGNETRAKELAYGILHWFDIPEDRVEMRLSDIDFTVSDDHPVLGNAYVLSCKVYNIGGRSSGTIIRFLDGDTIIDTTSVYVEADSNATVESIWTPLYAGTRNIMVVADPDALVDEIFENNNQASFQIQIYFFYDDMENGSGNFDHFSTVVRIDGEGKLEFLDEPIYCNISDTWNITDGFSLNTAVSNPNVNQEYRSSPNCYFMHEPRGGLSIPIDVAMAIDHSGSMDTSMMGQDRLYWAKEGAKGFVNNFAGDDQGSIWMFDNSVDQQQAFTNDVEDLIQAINLIPSGGWTALWDATIAAINDAVTNSDPEHFAAAIVLTDGWDTASTNSQTDAENAASASGIPVFMIGFADLPAQVNEAGMTVVATASNGGFYRFASSPQVLDEVYEEIADTIEELAQSAARSIMEDDGFEDVGRGDTALGSIGPRDSGSISIRIATSPDDAEEEVSTGNMDRFSTDLELTTDSVLQLIGLRFQDAFIPVGATITNAYIEFTCDEADSGATNLIFAGEDVDSAQRINSTNSDLSSRTPTTASVSWNNVPAWSVDSKYQTPDLTSIIQEIVDRGGWGRGNDIMILVSGTGERTAESFDGASNHDDITKASLLHVEFQFTEEEEEDEDEGDTDNPWFDGSTSNKQVTMTNIWRHIH